MRFVRGMVADRARWFVAFALLLFVGSAVPVLADSPPEQPPPVTLPQASEPAELTALPTSQDLAKTFAQFEAEEAQRQEQLESPAAVHEREASRQAYAHLSPSEAEQLLTSKFAKQLEALNAEPARFLSDATLNRPIGEDAAAVTDEGRKQLLEGTIPVRARNEEGELRKVNLNLQQVENGWEPTNPLVEVNIGESAEEGVEVGDEGLAISLAGAEEGIGRALDEKDIFFGEVEEGSDSDMLVSPIAGGVEVFDQLRSEDSPETLHFHMRLPPGASLRNNAGAAEVVSETGSRLAEVPPPVAVDAQGQEVPVTMEFQGDTITLQVVHREDEFTYPILVDPELKEEWYWHNWYNGENLQALTNGAWHWNTSEGPSSSYVYGSTSCIYSCWGSGRGLYMDTASGYLPANRWGQWSYSAPNSQTYLANAWVSPFWRDNHVNCPQSKYGQPYDYDGMWNETSWNRILYNQANEQGWSNIESWGRAFIIGMGTSSGISIPCWRDNMAGGVAIWLEDWSRPELSTSTTNKWIDTTPIRLNASAYDAGVGVRKFKATAVNASGSTEEWWTNNSCTGLYEAPCPHTWNLGEASQPQLSYSPAALPEGIDKLSVTAYDAIEKPSFTTNEVEIEVDHAAPSISLSGTLTEQAKLGTEFPSYTVRADATDGVAGSKNPADARSGVTSITFEEDGKVVSSYNPGCPTQSCAWFRELEVPASSLPAGAHTLRVKGTDALGHVATKELNFTVGDKQAPALSVTGLPTETPGPTYSAYWSSFGSEGTGNGQFKHPGDIAIDSKGNLWVVDESNNRVEEFNENGESLGKFGSTGSGNGQLSRPTALAITAQGNIWVADAGNNRIEEFNEKGEYLAKVGSAGSGNGQFSGPEGIAIDPKGNIWVSDTYHGRVQEFNEKGEFIKVVGSYGSGTGQLGEPTGIDIGPGGNVWIADWQNNRVAEFNEAGEFVRQFGSGGTGAGQFAEPDAMAVDSRGDVWVGDQNNGRIQEFKESGEYISQFGSQGSGKGQFSFGYPMGIAVDSKGNIWITDTGHNKVQHWLTPYSTVNGHLSSISASATDGGFGVASLTMKLTSEGPKTEVLEQTTQSCPKGQCALSASFSGPELAEKPAGAYILTVSATDGAGNVRNTSEPVTLDPGPPKISLSGTLAERAGEPLDASSGNLTIKASDADLSSSGVTTINVERDHQMVATFSSNCSSICQETTASYTYKALQDGAERSIKPVAEAAEGSTGKLTDISCLSAGNCWAVGRKQYTLFEQIEEGKKNAPLVEHWSGNEWQVVSMPEVPGASEVRFEGISCSSTSACTVVGYYTNSSGLGLTLAERWDGSKWTVSSTPNPVAPAAYLYGTSCTSESNCWAYGRTAGFTKAEKAEGKKPTPFFEHWTGSEWQVVTTPEVPGASEVYFEGISCSSTSACTVVGYYNSAQASSQPLAFSWDGTEWRYQPAPTRIEATTAPLYGVSCTGPIECAMVGYSRIGSGKYTVLAESESPGKDQHKVTVEAVDKFGNAESKTIAVDVPEEEGETPACSEEVKTSAAKDVVTPTQAASAVEGAVPSAVAASKATTEEVTAEEIDPSYSAPKPNLETIGSRAEGETSVTPQGGFTLTGIACITPAQTTSAATEAKIVNGDAAVFANTAPQSDTVIRPTAGGTTIVQSLRGTEAPSSFSWNVTVNPGEHLVQLPSGVIAVTQERPGGEKTAEVQQPPEPTGIESPAVLDEAAAQLKAGEFELAAAQAEEKQDEVVAVIPLPWVVLSQGGVVPAKIELHVTEVPTEYNVVFVPPPFELNFVPSNGNEAEEMIAEATISAVVNGNCLEGSPCGTFDADSAAHYAEYWGNPNHDRNPYYHDFGSNNCTNFLSQIMARGGTSFMRAFEHGDGSWWYKRFEFPQYPEAPRPAEWTESWVEADLLPRHLWQYGLAVIDSSNEPSGWTKGDILAENWYRDGKGTFNHLQFVVGTEKTGSSPREPLIANESEPASANYSHKPWIQVKQRIAEENPEGWNRVPLAVKHTIAVYGTPGAKKHDPANLYGPNGVFQG